jgi:hypothetical protein
MKGGKKGYMHAGMKNMSPSGDSGMKPPKGHVDDHATRSRIAPTPRSLGPREA